MNEERRAERPLIHDYHSHVTLYAALRGQPDLERFAAGLEGRARALDYLAALSREGLSLVTGWHSDRLALSPRDLEGFPPMIVVNSSLHGLLLSPAARPRLRELWPELEERGGEPRWAERNIGRLFSFYAELAGLDEAKLEAFMAAMEELGIGGLDDMTVASEEALRLVARSRFSGRIAAWATPEVFRPLSPRSRELCAGVKLFLDGSLGARSAALDEPFLDAAAGELLYSDEELRRAFDEAAGWGKALAVHAIGRRAIEQAIACAEGLSRDGLELPALRLEHVQFISPAQARRCKELGLLLSMQPNFNADSSDYADRLRPRHLEENDPFRMLIDEAGFVPGEDLLFGSDGMPHGPDFALERCERPPYAGQRLSRAEYEAGSRLGDSSPRSSRG